MSQILLLCCLLLVWPRRPEPRGSAAPPPRSPSARTLKPWRHASGWTCQRAQDEEDETAAEEGGVLLETINSCRPTFPLTFDTSHVVCGGLSPAMHVRAARRLRGETATGPRKNVYDDATKNSDLLHSPVSETARDEMEKRHHQQTLKVSLLTLTSRTKMKHLLLILNLRKKHSVLLQYSLTSTWSII